MGQSTIRTSGAQSMPMGGFASLPQHRCIVITLGHELAVSQMSC